MSWFRTKPDVEFEVDIPDEMREGMTYGGAIAKRIARKEALQVPAVLRGRNLICATLARLPIKVRNKRREEDDPTGFLDQIDPDRPNVVVLAETYEDLLFEGIAWWHVTAFGWRSYPLNAERIDPTRIYVDQGRGQVYIDGYPVRDDTVIRFDSPNPPVLVHAARAIRTCLTLDQAASRYADEPVPLGYLTPRDGQRVKEDRSAVEGLLDRWAEARARRAWGFLGAALEAKTLQFDAEQIQLAEQRQHAVLEIARSMGIDPEDLGVSTTSRTYQNSEQRRQDLLDFTLAHYMAALEQRLSMRDVLPRGYEAKVNLDAFLRADTITRMQAYKIGKEVGVYPDERLAELEDIPRVETPEIPPPQASIAEDTSEQEGVSR